MQIAAHVQLIARLTPHDDVEARAQISLLVEHLTCRASADSCGNTQRSSSTSGTIVATHVTDGAGECSQQEACSPSRSPSRRVSPLRLAASPLTHPDTAKEVSSCDSGALYSTKHHEEAFYAATSSPLICTMAAIPEDLTQREPAPLTPQHMRKSLSFSSNNVGRMKIGGVVSSSRGSDGDLGGSDKSWARSPPFLLALSEEEDVEDYAMTVEAAEDGCSCADHKVDLSSSALSNASTQGSSELVLARAVTEDELLRDFRARQFAAGRHAYEHSPPRERLRGSANSNLGASSSTGSPSAATLVHSPTPRPQESLATRMAQQRRERQAARAQKKLLTPITEPRRHLLAREWNASSGETGVATNDAESAPTVDSAAASLAPEESASTDSISSQPSALALAPAYAPVIEGNTSSGSYCMTHVLLNVLVSSRPCAMSHE